jgi:DNA-binding beta-propeller fold protein YncE
MKNGDVRGMIAVDKMGCKVLFINPKTYETEAVLEGFQRTVHELLVIPETDLAYVPIFGDGIHGRNPNPGHVLCIFDCLKRRHVGDIDLSPYVAPHTVRPGADGLIYITCENSAKIAVIDPKTHKMIDAIDSGSSNGHRLCISDDGRRLYTDNEEDATVSVIDVPKRRLTAKIATPQALAGIAVSGDGKTVVAVSDESPALFMIDAASESVTREVPLEGVPKAAQIARYSPDGRLLVVSGMSSDMVSLIETASGRQTAVPVGSQPMDFCFRGEEIFVGCQGDGTIHVIDAGARRHKTSFKAGTGCESVGFF